MDSITQIVLGAACGEASLGNKIGNKALLFGAIGGTIPDLDVFTSRWLYSNEIDILASHRGFSHSILFSIIGAFLFGYLIHWLYDRGKRKGTTTLKQWVWLFFLSLFTHIMLDSFTPYGTQILKPFSDFRLAFNNISVVDPFYTIPFLLAIIVLMFFNRTSKQRRLWLKIGVGISSLYMMFTIGNKFYINSIYKNALLTEEINFIRFQTQPTILNNFLWYGIAETDTNYYVGFYSLFDIGNTIKTWQELPKNHDLIEMNHPDIKTLSWFSNRYFNVIPADNGQLRFNDLRYPLLIEDDPNSSVFSFEILKEGSRWNIKPYYNEDLSSEAFSKFLARVRGI
jgi:inner membrane protein